jgi:hypothetical protein
VVHPPQEPVRRPLQIAEKAANISRIMGHREFLPKNAENSTRLLLFIRNRT